MAKRILTLCLALVIGIAFAMPAVAAVKSIKVGGDLTIRGIYRNNLDFGYETTANADVHSKSWLMSTTRLWVGAELTDNVSVIVRLLNERDWDTETAAATNVGIDLAYIKMKDLFIPGFSATLGRQEILLGKGFVVGNRNGEYGSSLDSILAYDLTSRKAFDAWRLDYEVGTAPVIVTLFDAKINETAAGNYDQDLWGLNVGYKNDNLKAEGYVLLLDDQTPNGSSNTNLYTYGARVDTNVLAVPGLNFNIEAAMQNGEYGGIKDKDGWAGYGDVSYTFQNPMQPKIGASWYYASGDKEAHLSGYTGNYVPLYPDNLSDRIGRMTYASQVNEESSYPNNADIAGDNISAPKIYGSFKPAEKHLLSLAWFPTTTSVVQHGSDSEELGTEIDFGYAYQYTEDVSFGLSVGYMKAGKLVKEVVTAAKFDDTAIEVIGTVAVSF